MQDDLNALTEGIIGGAITVHKRIGPCVLESVYEACLAYELRKRGYRVERQIELPVIYDDVRVDCGFRIDLLVNGLVIVEIKSVEVVIPFFLKKLLSHLRLANRRVGLLINFNVPVLIMGVHRVVNGFPG